MTAEIQTWLMNQAPAVVLLVIAIVILWRQYQATLNQLEDTKEWRSRVTQFMTDTNATLTQQSSRLSTVEYLSGLNRGRRATDPPSAPDKIPGQN